MFTIGSKVTHTYIPGIFTVAAEPQPNEIGTVLVAVTDAKGEVHWMTPERLRPAVGNVGGAEFGDSSNKAVNSRRHNRGDLPGMRGSLF